MFDPTLTDALEVMRLCEAEGDPYAKLCVVEIERLRTIEQAAREIDKAIGQWTGTALNPKVARAYGALCDALDGVTTADQGGPRVGA